ncbi:MAG: GerAB/ArcD/ProY family transporter, partial [Limnochordia bacterium]
MQQDNDRISTWQMMVILVSTINATGVLRLPRLLAERVGPDGWASLTVGHGAGFLIILVMIRLSRLYPGVTFVEYSRRICGPFGSWLIVITASSFWLLVMARIVREFAEVMKVFVLLRT